MAVGLVVGIDFDLNPTEFEELIDRRLINRGGFQYVTMRLSMKEAHDRAALKDYYRAACVKQDWLEGLGYADVLKFADVTVAGKSVVVVQPQGFDEPEPVPGGIIAGIGFTPSQSQLSQIGGQLDLRPNHQYAVDSFSKSDAESDEFLAARYITVAGSQGWPSPAKGLSIQRRTVEGNEYVLIQPAGEDAPG